MCVLPRWVPEIVALSPYTFLTVTKRKPRTRSAARLRAPSETIKPGLDDNEAMQGDEDASIDVEVERTLFVDGTEETWRDFEYLRVKLELGKEKIT